MKNIIKRGTSLLLVVAMLLSFAAVVGAEPATEANTAGAHLMLWADTVPLEAGKTVYVPIYAKIDSAYGVGALQFNVWCDAGVTLTRVTNDNKGTPSAAKGSFEAGADGNSGAIRVGWSGSTPLGWAYDDDDNLLPPTTTDILVCWAVVKSAADTSAGGYEIHFGPFKGDETSKPFKIISDHGNTVSNEMTADNATMTDGLVAVYPKGAELPTVILTQSSFAAPTQEGITTGMDEARGDYDLTKYVKLVTDAGLVDVTSLSVTMQGDNYVSLKADGKTLSLATASEKDKAFKLVVSSANGVTFPTAVELPFTVSKNPVFTMAGFEKGGSCAKPSDFNSSYKGPKYTSGTASPAYVSLTPMAFDQYGMPLEKNQYTATTEFELYADKDYTNKITDTTGFSVESSGSLKISDLKTDVWCQVRAKATVGTTEKYGEWIRFKIESQYPQPRKAIISLTDGTNPISNTIEIPAIGAPDKTITFSVDHFIDQNGTPMDKDTTAPKADDYTITAKQTQPTPGGTTAVAINNNSQLIMVDSTAASSSPITIEFEVMVNGQTIPAYLSDEAAAAEPPTASLTIKKAIPIASSLASKKNENDTFHIGEIYEANTTAGDGKVTLTELPGIGEEQTVHLAPLYKLDQYNNALLGTVVSPEHYSLVKVNDDNTETPITDCVTFKSEAQNHMSLTLTNALVKDAAGKETNKLALTEGRYKIKAEWSVVKGQSPVLTAESAPFELKLGSTKVVGAKPEYDGKATAPTLDVPYKYGQSTTTPKTQVTVWAKFETKYGPTTLVGSADPIHFTLSDITLDGTKLKDDDTTSIQFTEETSGGKLTVTSSVAQYFGEKTQMVLEATMTATLPSSMQPENNIINFPISITLRKDASTLSAVYIGMDTKSDLEMPRWTWNVNVDSSKKDTTINLTSPETETKYYFDIKYFDQYGVPMTSTFGTNTELGTTGLKWQGGSDKMLIAEANAEGTFSLTAPGNSRTYVFNVTFAKMRFVNKDGGDYKVNMWMNTNERTYDGKTWAEVCTKWGAAQYPDVHIRNEDGTAGVDVTNDVKVVVKQNGEEVYDSFKTYTEAPKANAGTYTIELIYQKDENTSYSIDSTSFTIKKATVTITANGTITKEYDGSPALPSGVTNDSFTKTGAYETVVVDESKLEYAQSDVKLGEDGKVTTIQIRLKSGETTCLKSGTDPAVVNNYNVNLDGLTGTITKRVVVVSPNFREFLYGENDKITEALSKGGTDTNAGFTYEAKTGTLPTGEKAPTFSGSMCLMNGAERLTIYNAGEYSIAQGDLTISSNYQIEWSQNDNNKTWLITPKRVDPFNVTLQAEYGINGSELYAMLNTAKVPVDGQQVNFNTLYYVEALYIKDAGKNNVSNENTTVNAGEYTVTSLPATTLGIANYEFKTAPKLKIRVKPHQLSDNDIHITKGQFGYDTTEHTCEFDVSFTYNGRTVPLTEGTDYEITDNSNKRTDAYTDHLTIAAKGSNVTGSAKQIWKIFPHSVEANQLTFAQNNIFLYNGQEKTLTPENVTVTVKDGLSADVAKILAKVQDGGFNLNPTTKATDAGEYEARVYFTGNFTAADSSASYIVKWEIKKSAVVRIGDQTPKTKYGGSGSLTFTLTPGQQKGLTNGEWNVSNVGEIFKEAKVEYKDGIVTISWKLKDTTKVGDTGSFKVTYPESDNYGGYDFTVTVTAIKKDAQTGFGFTYANPIVGYAEDTYTNPLKNAKTTPAYTSSNENVATVDSSSGVVTILDVGETIITATAPEDAEYASATASYTLTVVPSPLTVTASSATMTANDPVPSFAASVTGLKRGQTAAQVFQTLTASAATDGKTAGTYAVNASATLKTDFVPRYTLRFVPGTLTVNPAQTAIDVVLPIIIGGNTCANGYANCACESFYDLDASRWYHEAIDWAYSLGLMNGTTKSTFGPNAAATRAQTWTMLARIAGQDTRRSSTWYEVGQKWAMNLGITDGTNPMGSLTREQLAAMLYRYVGSPAVNGTLTFTDSANVSAWARNAMIWAVQNGILDGVGGNRLNPKGTTTRAQAAAIFMRFSNLINK